MVEDAIRPRGPYSLALTAQWAGDATRYVRDGVLTAALPRDGLAAAWQRPDGRIVMRASDEEALARMRFVLALEDDHSDFLRRFRDDPLLGSATVHLRGLRPLRVGTVAQALLRAFCGQLIDSKTARSLERRLVRATTPARAGVRLHLPPEAGDLAAGGPARLRALGLHARRAAALVRICGELDPERLRALPTDRVAARLERERGLGPWSVGVVCLEGLGRYERGLVGDLGLVKLLAALRGRRVEGWETAELLEPYGEWAGLASVYLLTAYGAGLIPGVASRARVPPRFRVAAA
jgi:3-methyladenine DNA glycosylase/8-oxoguanine DNA glycosylase